MLNKLKTFSQSLNELTLPDHVDDQSLRTRKGQINSKIDEIRERDNELQKAKQKLGAVRAGNAEMEREELWRRKVEYQENRADLAQEIFDLRERIHDFLMDLIPHVEKEIGAAQKGLEQTIQERREALDEADLLPTDADVRRGSIFGQMVHLHPDVEAAKTRLNAVEAKKDAPQDRIKQNEKQAKVIRDEIDACKNRAKKERQRQARVIEKEKKQKRKLIAKQRQRKERKAEQHPFRSEE